MKKSSRFSLNWDDVDRWVKNTALFGAPAMIIFLTTLQTGGSFQEAVMALKVWLLNTAVDLARKYMSGK